MQRFKDNWSRAIYFAATRICPVIVDAAGQLPPAANLKRFVAEGAEPGAFRRKPAAGVGRAAKCGKEEIIGLLTALRLFLEESSEERHARWLVVREDAACGAI